MVGCERQAGVVHVDDLESRFSPHSPRALFLRRAGSESSPKSRLADMLRKRHRRLFQRSGIGGCREDMSAAEFPPEPAEGENRQNKFKRPGTILDESPATGALQAVMCVQVKDMPYSTTSKQLDFRHTICIWPPSWEIRPLKVQRKRLELRYGWHKDPGRAPKRRCIPHVVALKPRQLGFCLVGCKRELLKRARSFVAAAEEIVQHLVCCGRRVLSCLCLVDEAVCCMVGVDSPERLMTVVSLVRCAFVLLH